MMERKWKDKPKWIEKEMNDEAADKEQERMDGREWSSRWKWKKKRMRMERRGWISKWNETKNGAGKEMMEEQDRLDRENGATKEMMNRMEGDGGRTDFMDENVW